MTDDQERMRAVYFQWEAATNAYHEYLKAVSSGGAPGAVTVEQLIDRMSESKKGFEDASKPFVRLVQ